MRFARMEIPPLVSGSFEAALKAADAVAVASEQDTYYPVAGVDDQILVVNRVAADGSSWTAVAGVTPRGAAVRVVFINGSGRQGNSFDLPHAGGPSITEMQCRIIAGLVLAAPRAFARRLCCGDVVLDRLIEAAWQGGRALKLSEAEYGELEQRLIAAHSTGGDPLTRRLGTPALRAVPAG